MNINIYFLKNKILITGAILLICFMGTSFAGQDENIDQFGVRLPQNTHRLVGHIDGFKVDQSSNGVIVLNDQPFRVTSATRFYNTYNKRVSIATFLEQYHYIGCHINSSVLLAIWPEDNEDNSNPTSQKSKSITTPSSSENESLIKNNGVWKN